MSHDSLPPVGGSPGDEEPLIRVTPPGPTSKTFALRLKHFSAPMGAPKGSGSSGEAPIVLSEGKGDNLWDVDGNRYIDLTQGFGSLLLGHSHPSILRTIQLQAPRLMQGLGDVYSADAKVALVERLAKLYPGEARVILGQSGADAVTAALKTALLCTRKPFVLAFKGAYHGLSYAPLAICGLRESYREPFSAQLNPNTVFLPFPDSALHAGDVLEKAKAAFSRHPIGAVVVEPILGRGGCLPWPSGFLKELSLLARERGALLVADEIWTGLGRSGSWLHSAELGVVPDLVCLGKGLGGGLPISACIGASEVMQAWAAPSEVVHTSTFAGAPLAAATAIALLNELERHQLVSRAETLGERLKQTLREQLPEGAEVTGKGLMLGVHLTGEPGWGKRVQKALLERGYLVISGGGARSCLTLTPALTVSEARVMQFAVVLGELLSETQMRASVSS